MLSLETDTDNGNESNGKSKPGNYSVTFDFAVTLSSSAQINQNSVQVVFALFKRLKITQYQFSILGLINRTSRLKFLDRMVSRVRSGALPTRCLVQ